MVGIGGGRQEEAAGAGQPKSTEMLRSEGDCAKTDGGELHSDAFAAVGLLLFLLLEIIHNRLGYWILSDQN